MACLSSLTAEVSRPAVRTKSGVRRAKRTQPPKKLEVHSVAADEAGLGVREHIYEEPLDLGADSVDVEVHACSLGSTDVQHLRGDWGPCVMPLVPGRDAVGVVVNTFCVTPCLRFVGGETNGWGGGVLLRVWG